METADMDFGSQSEPVESGNGPVDTPTVTGEYENFGVTPTAPESTDSTGPKDNPKWNGLLEKVPAPFHDEVKKYLSERDQEVNGRFQQIHDQYKPFKAFQDQQIAPDMLMQSYGMMQAFQQNPVQFFEQVKGLLMSRGLLEEQAQQVAEEVTGQAGEGNEDDPYLSQIQSLRETIEQRDNALFEAFQQQEKEQFEQQAFQEESQRIESDMQAVEQRVGKMSEPLKAQIVEKAMIMGQQTGRYVSIPEAATEVFKFIHAARGNARPAPNTIPTNGSPGITPQKDPSEMNQQERLAYALQIRDSLA